MRELSAVKFVEKRSRFYAHLYKIDSPSDADEILKVQRSAYKKAVHHCHALRFFDGEGIEEAFRNDGEVGRPGQVLVEILKKEELSSHCLMVSRIFGGTKLGVGGVSRAFRSAGEAAVEEYKKRC